MTAIKRPEPERELSRLKDFQRDTVEYVFNRMYSGERPAKRFLVADEVGLGKTMVARGVVAKVVDHLWEKVGRIDVVYICSNGSIARQNINRLNVSEAKDASLPSRITLLPTVVSGLKHRKLNFISLTPQTSFDLRSNLGTYEERALLYWLLPEQWKESGLAVQNLLQGTASRDNFRQRVKDFDRAQIDPELKAAFHSELAKHHDVQQKFMEAADRFRHWRQNLPDEDRVVQCEVVGRLRLELAISCLSALEPDLIILDEFQRFKHLLDGTDQASELAQKLFLFPDARVLLLSATPYKMYTLSEESETDDHFRDFLQTVSFLHQDNDETAAFKKQLDAYRNAVFTLGTDGNAVDRLTTAKEAVEYDLRKVMVRTERLAAEVDRNGMLREVPAADVHLQPGDVSTYVALARVAQALEHSEITEYWKSAPYLLNFMDDYQLKADFEDVARSPKLNGTLRTVLAACPGALLNWDDVERYRALDPANARLRQLQADISAESAWQLLWLPPALPYYRLGGPYADSTTAHAKKRLIFSSWQVVPKVVASVLSYEAERAMFGERLDVDRPNTPEGRARITQLLRFARSADRLTGLSLLTLLYPSIALAELGDPLLIAREHSEHELDSEAVLRVVANRVRESLQELTVTVEQSGASDDRWYWLAPVLLDLQRHPSAARDWLRQEGLADVWRGEETDKRREEDVEGPDAWADHVAEFVRMANGSVRLGPPPDDLAEVLGKVALGAPGVVALRALSRICGDETLTISSIRNNAGWIAWGFRTLFNTPEVTAMLRRVNPAEPYWQRVLEYAIAGGLQSVLDEYLHVLQDWEGVAHKPVRAAARTVASTAVRALQLRTANVGVDAISATPDALEITERRMRARFAARFGARQADEGAGALRADDVRAAFNSPFWPFVLCSTSVGQEGLDFHLYCHAIVHWNLPNNPVDLEQREGRVHRYKGHAIRKNAALLHGREAMLSDAIDPWNRLFDLARDNRPAGETDLTPYWVLPAENGAKIERHVLLLPLSRDVERAEMLRRTLTVYRMAFGQNRQDDIVAYLTNRFPAEQIEQLTEQLKIDLAPRPPKNGRPHWVAWSREQDTDDEPPVAQEYRSELTVERAASLLVAFVERCRAQTRVGIEQYRELLDRFVAIQRGERS